MALNASGPISLGGSTSGQSINLELGLSATAAISLNDAAVRTLLGAASGAITFNNAYGKSSAPPSPTVTLTNVTGDNGGTVTLNWTTNRSSGYNTLLFFNGNNGATQNYVNTSGSGSAYLGTCQNVNYQVKLQKISTGAIEASSNIINYTSPPASYGSEISSTCSGCTRVATNQGYTCGSTFTTNYSNNYGCCAPLDWSFPNPNSNGAVSWYVNHYAPSDNWAIYFDLIHYDSGSAVQGGSFGGFANNYSSGVQYFNASAGPGLYYITAMIGLGPSNNRYEAYYDGSSNPVYLS